MPLEELYRELREFSHSLRLPILRALVRDSKANLESCNGGEVLSGLMEHGGFYVGQRVSYIGQLGSRYSGYISHFHRFDVAGVRPIVLSEGRGSFNAPDPKLIVYDDFDEFGRPNYTWGNFADDEIKKLHEMLDKPAQPMTGLDFFIAARTLESAGAFVGHVESEGFEFDERVQQIKSLEGRLRELMKAHGVKRIYT